MTSYFFLVGLFLVFSENSASAIDCSKASTVTEGALCGDDLRQMDGNLNEEFSKLHDVLSDAAAESLLLEQRAWIKRRDASCTEESKPSLAACLKQMMLDRIGTIREKPSGEHPDNGADPTPGQDFMVGDRKLSVLVKKQPWPFTGNKYQLVFNDNLLLEAYSKFNVEGRFHNKVVDAVAIAVDRGGSLDCAKFAVIEAHRGEPLKVTRLPREPDAEDKVCGYTISNSPRGFTFDNQDGVEINLAVTEYEWNSSGYFGDAGYKTFEPVKGTKLEEIERLEEGSSPLQNEEFFQALKSASGHDWRVFARALEYIHRVPTDIDKKFVVLAECSSRRPDRCVNGGRGRLDSEWYTAGFAAIGRKNREGFFAVQFRPSGLGFDNAPKIQDGCPEGEVTTYPARDKWPAELLPVLKKWIEEEC